MGGAGYSIAQNYSLLRCDTSVVAYVGVFLANTLLCQYNHKTISRGGEMLNIHFHLLRVQVVLVLRDFVLRYFALTDLKIYTAFRIYAIIFGLTRMT
jgi:hypothetical protein